MDEWLEVFADDAVLWMPTWRNEYELTHDPNTELSFIYLEGKTALRERVSRLTSGLSVSSMPQPRTCHLITGFVGESNSDELVLKSSWTSHIYDHKLQGHTTYFGHYEHTLREHADGFQILRKRVVLMNDYIVSKLDFYYV